MKFFFLSAIAANLVIIFQFSIVLRCAGRCVHVKMYTYETRSRSKNTLLLKNLCTSKMYIKYIKVILFVYVVIDSIDTLCHETESEFLFTQDSGFLPLY